MKKTILACSLLCMVLSVYARSIDGIRIESSGTPVMVFINGFQVNTPTVSCFIVNPGSGIFKVEVYEPTRRGFHGQAGRGNLLYSEEVYYKGRGVKEIFVSDSGSKPNGSGSINRNRVMDEVHFSEFLRLLKEKHFDSERNKQMENALLNSNFTSLQCKLIVNEYSFGNGKLEIMKKMYPRIVDKESFFLVMESLTFQSEKDQMNQFIRKYHEKKSKR